MSMLLSQAPRFSSGAAMLRHYKAVRQRMAALAPPPLLALPSPEMMANGNMLPFEIARPLPVERAKPIHVGDLAIVEDIVPKQFLAIPDKIKLLSPEAENVAVRRALYSLTLGLIAEDGRKPKPLAVMAAVASAFKIDRRAISDPSRKAGIVRIRQIASALARKFTGYSLPQIGLSIGGRDHTTVLHGARKYEGMVNAALAECVDPASRWC